MRLEIVLVIGAFLLAGWLFGLWRHPYTSCSWCNGTGRNGGSTRASYGRCWRCKGSPERLKFGARLMHRRLK